METSRGHLPLDLEQFPDRVFTPAGRQRRPQFGQGMLQSGVFGGEGFDEGLLFVQEDGLLLVLQAQLGADGLEKIDRHYRVLFDEGIETLAGHGQERRRRQGGDTR